MSNPFADEMEPAEGSRETVEANLEDTPSEPRPESDAQRGGEDAGGISNRPLHEEESRQESLPPRGKPRKSETDHA